MNSIRCLAVLALSYFVGAPQAQAPVPTEHPELFGGRWEAVTATGVEGFGFSIVTSSTGPIGSERFDWQTISTRVYYRDSGKETWGYFEAKPMPKLDYPLPGNYSYADFDGRRLHILCTEHDGLKPFDLDVAFSPFDNRWLGTWSRSGKSEHVALARPESKSDVQPNAFVGEWVDESSPESPNIFGPARLNIRQSPDGALSAWLDRTATATDLRTGYIHNERRNGQELFVESMTDTELVLNTGNFSGAPYQYRGTLSADGQVLIGVWGESGGGRLAAPGRFRRAHTKATPGIK